jgi:hypothetical protein
MLRLSFLFVPVILVGLAVLTIFLIALFKSGPVARWIFTVFLTLLLFFCFFVLIHRPRVIVHAEPSRAVSVAQVFNHSPAADPVVWQEALEEEFVPDSYSSPNAAAFGLGAFAVPEMIADLFKEQVPEIFIAEERSNSILLGELQRGLKRAYEGREIYIRSIAPDVVSEGQVWISLAVQEEPGRELQMIDSLLPIQKAHWVNAGSRRGMLTGVVQTAGGKTVKSVSFDYRPWVTDFEHFKASMASEGRHWLRFVSQDTAVSEEEARSQVMRQILQSFSYSVTEKDLLQHGLIADLYSQRLAGMAGPIWRHAVLLNVSPKRMEELSSAKVQINRRQRTTWAKTLGSLVGMIVLVCLVYAVANAATKGYYSAVLAVTAVLAAVILGFLIVLMTKAGVCI